MDVHSIKIDAREIQTELDRVKAAAPAGMVDDACEVYKQARPALDVAMAILGAIYPPGAAGVAVAKVILDKACESAG